MNTLMSRMFSLLLLAAVPTLSGCPGRDGLYLVQVVRDGAPVKGSEVGRVSLQEAHACYDKNGKYTGGRGMFSDLFTLDEDGTAVVSVGELSSGCANIGRFFTVELVDAVDENGENLHYQLRRYCATFSEPTGEEEESVDGVVTLDIAKDSLAITHEGKPNWGDITCPDYQI